MGQKSHKLVARVRGNMKEVRNVNQERSRGAASFNFERKWRRSGLVRATQAQGALLPSTLTYHLCVLCLWSNSKLERKWKCCELVRGKSTSSRCAAPFNFLSIFSSSVLIVCRSFSSQVLNAQPLMFCVQPFRKSKSRYTIHTTSISWLSFFSFQRDNLKLII